MSLTDTIRKPAPAATVASTPFHDAQSSHQKLALSLDAERGSTNDHLEQCEYRLTQYQMHLKSLRELLKRSPEQLDEILALQIQGLGHRLRTLDRRMDALDRANQIDIGLIDPFSRITL